MCGRLVTNSEEYAIALGRQAAEMWLEELERYLHADAKSATAESMYSDADDRERTQPTIEKTQERTQAT
eukprot:465453-Amphidinium_carterae.1